jgi:protein ImuB
MTVTHAQSLIPDLTVVDATPEDNEAALFRLALWCIKYSPLVTPNPPDGVFIDVAGSAHLFHGEAALLQDLCKRLGTEGIEARAALADTAGCAWASHAKGFHLHVLLKPCVNLSIHTASDVRPPTFTNRQ